MARIVGRLKGRQVQNAKPKRGRDYALIPDGGNLLLQVSRGKDGHISRSWLFKYELIGKRHEIGLGPLHTVGLAEAREKARGLRNQLLDGIDPLAERRKARQALIAEQAKAVTFEEVAAMYVRLHGDAWSAQHRQQWINSVAQHVHPKIGKLAVKDIDQATVLKLIEPLWSTRTVTASRLLNRIEVVMDYAAAHGMRQGDNPAHILSALPKASKIAPVENFAAVAVDDIGALMAELRALDTLAAKALQFLILCASRSGEVLGADWSEIDLAKRVWAIPPERMKGRRLHRVPLSDAAIEILGGLPLPHSGRVFPITESGAMDRGTLKRLRPAATVHGMRAAFRTWASERTAFPSKLVEAALAHRLGDHKTEQSYIRGDLFTKRVTLMAEWARYGSKPAPVATPTGATVVPIRKIRAGA